VQRQLLSESENIASIEIGNEIVNGQGQLIIQHYEITVEYLAALRSFSELDAEENRPWAANLELAWFPINTFQLSARIEASGDVADEPELQYGLSAAWLIGGRVNMAVDYLYGRFKNDFAFDDDENEITTRHLLAAQFSIEF